jgi:hypothetical protein
MLRHPGKRHRQTRYDPGVQPHPRPAPHLGEIKAPNDSHTLAGATYGQGAALENSHSSRSGGSSPTSRPVRSQAVL